MAKIKVTIDRDGCIGDMVCVNLCPDVFEMNQDDGKSQIVAKWRTNASDLSTGLVDESLEECVKSAAESCPVSVIHFEKV
ncbi:MAG: ferredoxin [Fervidicoccaceae archaeon]|jgi:ferredoxin|nr:MAG: ferredoxin [Fervidicoccus sp.]